MTQPPDYYIFISDIDVFRVIERDRYFADPNRAGLNSYRVDDQKSARTAWDKMPKEYNFKVYMVPLKGSSVEIIGPDCAILTPVEQEVDEKPVTVLELGEFLIQNDCKTNFIAELAEALLQQFDIKRKSQ